MVSIHSFIQIFTHSITPLELIHLLAKIELKVPQESNQKWSTFLCIRWPLGSEPLSFNKTWPYPTRGFSGGSAVKESVCNVEDLGSIPGLGRFPGEENGNPLQYFCLENSMDRGAWQSMGLQKSQTWWRDETTTATYIYSDQNSGNTAQNLLNCLYFTPWYAHVLPTLTWCSWSLRRAW